MSREILDIFADAIAQRHGSNVIALDMSRVPLTMEAFLIATAENTIQARAIADRVEEVARETGFRKHHIEGYEDGSWILIDYVDLVIHIFLEPVRSYYGLEMLWGDVPAIRYEETWEDPVEEPGSASN